MTVSFDKKLAELDAYLQMLIEQSEKLDKKIELASCGAEKNGLLLIKKNLESLLGSIKHAIVLLQIAKVSIKTSPPPTPPPPLKQQHPQQRLTSQATKSFSSTKNSPLISTRNSNADTKLSSNLQEQQHQASPKPPARAFKKNIQQQSQQSIASSSSSSISSASSPDALKVAAQAADLRQSSSSSQQQSQKVQHIEDREGGSLRFVNNFGAEPCLKKEGSIDNTGGTFQISSAIIDDTSVKHSAANSQSLKDGAAGMCLIEDDDDDDDFFDAADEQQPCNISTRKNQPKGSNVAEGIRLPNSRIMSDTPEINVDPMEDGSIDWDALYDEEEEDLGSLENQGSVIKHLMSQIRIGMDLTKVVLPTFILERRSLLEMYADFFAHPDLFSSIPDYETPEERMVQLVRWYLSAFHAGRKSSVAKKPYNPILGEIFLCHWNLNAGSADSARDEIIDTKNSESREESDESAAGSNNNIERANSTESTSSTCDIEKFSKQLPQNSLLFVAEQVSHHPPVSAFYAENPDKLISCCAHIYTRSKYLGLSVGVHNIGQGVINLLKHNETYVCTFPSAYGRSILTVPWVELGGSVNITCEQTGYSANIEFVTKPFYGGKKHRVVGEILKPNKEQFITIDGEWNGSMYSKSPSNPNDKKVFVDTTRLPVIKKHVRSISSQETFESRNVWKEVTRALKLRDVASATEAKSFIEQRQRDLLKDRQEKGVKWRTRYFESIDDGWSYSKPLADRIRSTDNH